MPLYEYTAKNQSGRTVKGTLEAKDRADILEQLRNDSLIVISIEEAKGEGRVAKGKNKRIRIYDITVFSRQLATMVDAGIPILGSLDILAQQAENKNFKQVLNAIKYDVETGSSLSKAFARHVKVFSSLYVSMVKAGESSGTLADILDRLSTYLEKTAALQRKIQAALIYPAVITSMAIGITILLLVKVIPVFRSIYAGFGAALPLPTLILIEISDIIRKFFLAFLLAVFLAGYLLKRYINTEKGRLHFDSMLLKLPIFGILFTKVSVSRFTRTLSTLVKSGVPILACLEVVAKTCGNKAFEVAIDQVRTAVREGENIATQLGKSKIFPPMVVKMIGVGEQTGELEKMLGKVADFYDEEVEITVSGLTSLLEPLLIAFLGIVIGGIVICMFLPIFKLSTIVTM